MTPLLQDFVVSFSLIAARTTAFVMTFPFFGGQAAPQSAKAGLTLALTIFWMSMLQTLPAEELREIGSHWLLYALMLGKEVVVGLVLGYAFSLFLVPFRIAGEYVGQEMGLTIASLTDPTRPQTGTVVGQFFETIGMLLFFIMDLHQVFIGAFHASFVRRPVGAGLGNIAVMDYVQLVAVTEESGLEMVTPISCWLFFVSVTLALMARAAPQLNIMNVGSILKLITGLVGTLILLPELAPNMMRNLQRFSELIYAL